MIVEFLGLVIRLDKGFCTTNWVGRSSTDRQKKSYLTTCRRQIRMQSVSRRIEQEEKKKTLKLSLSKLIVKLSIALTFLPEK